MTTKMVGFDLDTTIYDTTPRRYMFDLDEPHTPEFWKRYSAEHINDNPGPAWPIAQHFSEIGVPFFILSGRHDSARKTTLQQLHDDGIHPWALFLCDDRYNNMAHGKWKAMRLDEIRSENNWEILYYFEDIAEVARENALLVPPIDTVLVHHVDSGFDGLVG